MSEAGRPEAGIAGMRMLLGVSGGIAAYKAAELVRRLRDAGWEVRVVLTASATRFVTPITFQALSGNVVRSSLWDESAEAAMGHIELARWADRVLIAPASADIIARLAHGQANDLLTTLCLASTAPLAVAPAMNHQMWAHAATQANMALLRERGVQVLGPAAGDQACGETGPGRLMEVADIISELSASRAGGQLDGVRVLVSAGPTFEDIDPVRYIGNRSSGRMGFAVAEAARRQGAKVTLIAGPVSLPTPAGVARTDVRSAKQMRDAVFAAIEGNDIFISAAAVADYGPQNVATAKIKKSDQPRNIMLVPNTDILAEVAALPQRPFLVGFAAETDDLEANARGKLEHKQLDLIAANRVGANLGFDQQTNALLLLWPDDHGGLARENLGEANKSELARHLVVRIAERYQHARGE